MAKKTFLEAVKAKLASGEELSKSEKQFAALLGLPVEAKEKKVVKKKVTKRKKKKVTRKKVIVKHRPSPKPSEAGKPHVIGSLDITSAVVPLTKRAKKILSMPGMKAGRKFHYNSPNYCDFVQAAAQRQRNEDISAGETDVPTLSYYEKWIDTDLANQYRHFRTGKRWE